MTDHNTIEYQKEKVRYLMDEIRDNSRKMFEMREQLRVITEKNQDLLEEISKKASRIAWLEKTLRDNGVAVPQPIDHIHGTVVGRW